MLEQRKLDLSVFENDTKCISIGSLSKNMVDFIVNKRPELKDIIYETDILLWNNRIAYTEKHKDNFQNPDDYYNYIQDIPTIIKNPDYIGLPPDNKSIQFIKRCEYNIIVAVRISSVGKLSYRTMYPITESQLEDYQRKNKAWKCVDKT